MEFYGIKKLSIVYKFGCESGQENCVPKNDDILKKSKLFEKKTGIPWSNVNNFEGILNELKTQTYDDYASILFIVGYICECDMKDQLQRLCDTIQNNKHLRYITKFITTVQNVSYNHLLELNKTRKIRRRHPGDGIENQLPKFAGQGTFHLDNSIMVSHKVGVKNPLHDLTGFVVFMMILFFEEAYKISAQEMGIVQNSGVSDEMETFIVESECFYSSTVGNYLFNINPALGIVFNTRLYTDTKKTREGSEYDVAALKRMLTFLNIPHIVVPDATAEHIRNTMEMVKHMKYKNLKYLIVFASGHGAEGGEYIRTTDGQYHIQQDIIQPIEDNENLQFTSTIVGINACRNGPISIDPNFHISKKNLTLMYSTSLGKVSYLWKDKGSKFIQLWNNSICQEPLQKYNIHEIFSSISSTMKRFKQNPEYRAAQDSESPILSIDFKNMCDYENFLHELKVFANKNSK